MKSWIIEKWTNLINWFRNLKQKLSMTTDANGNVIPDTEEEKIAAGETPTPVVNNDNLTAAIPPVETAPTEEVTPGVVATSEEASQGIIADLKGDLVNIVEDVVTEVKKPLTALENIAAKIDDSSKVLMDIYTSLTATANKLNPDGLKSLQANQESNPISNGTSPEGIIPLLQQKVSRVANLGTEINTLITFINSNI